MPASPQEKGGVEGEVGYFRRNHLVPVPSIPDLSALNRYLLVCCQQDERRRIGDRPENVGVGMQAEHVYLLPLAAEGFDLAESRFALVDRKGCVQVGGNGYSVPLNAGTKVQVKVWPSVVEVWQSGHRIAVHERCPGRGQQILELTHYLDVLHRKPGAFAGSKPLSQWRSQGRWPPCFDLLWKRLQKRHGEGPGTQQMVELLQLVRPHGEATLVTAVEKALTLGCNDAASVQYLVTQLTLPHPSPPTPEPLPPCVLGDLSRFERPLPEVASYDQLLSLLSQRGVTSPEGIQ